MSDNSFNEAAVTAPESISTAAVETVETQTPEEQPEPKTFTQEELDRIVAKEKAKERRRLEREQAAQQPQQPIVGQAPKPDQFKTAEEYAEAYSEWKQADQQVRQQRNQAESTYAEREEEARDKYDDYHDVTRNPDLRITQEMAIAIKESDIGPEIAYHLGKNPKEATRIAELSPVGQIREIGKIEASLASNTPPVKKASSAPEPIKPGTPRSSVPKHDPTDPRSNTMSDAEWIKARNAQIAKRSQ